MKRRALRGTMLSHSICGAPCTWQRKPRSLYVSDAAMPDRASRREANTSWGLFPILETIPIPVTTTRLILYPSYAAPPHRAGSRLATLGSLVRISGPGRTRLLIGVEQADAKVRRRVDDLPIGHEPSVGDGELELAQDDALQVDHVLDLLDRRQHHAAELDLAHPERAAAARSAEPAQEKAGQLPQRVESEATGHDRI